MKRVAAALMFLLACEAFAKTGTVTVSVVDATGAPRQSLSRAVASALLASGASVAVMGEGARCEPPCQRLQVELSADGGVDVRAEVGALTASRHLAHVEGDSTLELARAIALEGQSLLRGLLSPARSTSKRPPVRESHVGPPAAPKVKPDEAPIVCAEPLPPTPPEEAVRAEPVVIARRPRLPASMPDAAPRVEAARDSSAPTSWLSFGARGLVQTYSGEDRVALGVVLGARAELAHGLDVRLSLAATAPTLDDTGAQRIRLRTLSGSAMLSTRLGRLPLWMGAGAEFVFVSVDRPVPDFDTLETESWGGLVGVETRLRFARATVVLGVQGSWHPFLARVDVDATTPYVYPKLGMGVLAGLELDVF